MKPLKKLIKWTGMGAAGLIVVVLIGGRSYQLIAEKKDRERFPPPGELVDVDGHKMHIYCQGEGSPTLVIEQGLNNASVSWWFVNQRLAERTRTCAYDRLGLGWSDPVDELTPAAMVASNLHQLLMKAGIDDDLILVGWSAGGIYVRAFYHRYPDQVKGMVLVDSAHEQQASRLPGYPGPHLETGRTRLLGHLAPFGLLRLTGFYESGVAQLPIGEEGKALTLALLNQSYALRTQANEIDSILEDQVDGQPPKPLGDLPLTVISRGKPVSDDEPLPAGVTVELVRQQQVVWNDMQREIASLSSRSKQVIARASGHSVHVDDPDLLVKEVLEMVELVRSGSG